MEENFKLLYNEFRILISDTEFIFFMDRGFGCRGIYHSEKHLHEFNEIIYCIKGSVEIEYKKGIEKITPGCMALIPKKTEHSLTTEDGTFCIFLSFWKNNAWNEEKNIQIFKNFTVFERLLEYYYSNYTYKKELITACLHEIAAMLMENSLVENIEQKNTVTLENDGFRRYIIEQYFRLHFDKNPKITELADSVHLSVQQTQRIIEKLYSKTFSSHILTLRMTKAKNLLKDTNYTIENIAIASGYKSVHNFYRVFKSYTGMTPKEYRKKGLLS